MNVKSTKKAEETDTLRAEYTREALGKGVRGKYHQRHVEGSNLVLLKPETAKAFPTAEAVNEALMGLIQLAQRMHTRS
jgi:hypothetical protein